MSYDHIYTILRLFDSGANFSLTTSETKLSQELLKLPHELSKELRLGILGN